MLERRENVQGLPQYSEEEALTKLASDLEVEKESLNLEMLRPLLAELAVDLPDDFGFKYWLAKAYYIETLANPLILKAENINWVFKELFAVFSNPHPQNQYRLLAEKSLYELIISPFLVFATVDTTQFVNLGKLNDEGFVLTYCLAAIFALYEQKGQAAYVRPYFEFLKNYFSESSNEIIKEVVTKHFDSHLIDNINEFNLSELFSLVSLLKKATAYQMYFICSIYFKYAKVCEISKTSSLDFYFFYTLERNLALTEAAINKNSPLTPLYNELNNKIRLAKRSICPPKKLLPVFLHLIEIGDDLSASILYSIILDVQKTGYKLPHQEALEKDEVKIFLATRKKILLKGIQELIQLSNPSFSFLERRFWFHSLFFMQTAEGIKEHDKLFLKFIEMLRFDHSEISDKDFYFIKILIPICRYYIHEYLRTENLYFKDFCHKFFETLGAKLPNFSFMRAKFLAETKAPSYEIIHNICIGYIYGFDPKNFADLSEYLAVEQSKEITSFLSLSKDSNGDIRKLINDFRRLFFRLLSSKLKKIHDGQKAAINYLSLELLMLFAEHLIFNTSYIELGHDICANVLLFKKNYADELIYKGEVLGKTFIALKRDAEKKITQLKRTHNLMKTIEKLEEEVILLENGKQELESKAGKGEVKEDKIKKATKGKKGKKGKNGKKPNKSKPPKSHENKEKTSIRNKPEIAEVETDNPAVIQQLMAEPLLVYKPDRITTRNKKNDAAVVTDEGSGWKVAGQTSTPKKTSTQNAQIAKNPVGKAVVTKVGMTAVSPARQTAGKNEAKKIIQTQIPPKPPVSFSKKQWNLPPKVEETMLTIKQPPTTVTIEAKKEDITVAVKHDNLANIGFAPELIASPVVVDPSPLVEEASKIVAPSDNITTSSITDSKAEDEIDLKDPTVTSEENTVKVSEDNSMPHPIATVPKLKIEVPATTVALEAKKEDITVAVKHDNLANISFAPDLIASPVVVDPSPLVEEASKIVAPSDNITTSSITDSKAENEIDLKDPTVTSEENTVKVSEDNSMPHPIATVPKLKIEVPATICAIAKVLKEKGYKVALVGGQVKERIRCAWNETKADELKLSKRDFDFVTDAPIEVLQSLYNEPEFIDLFTVYNQTKREMLFRGTTRDGFKIDLVSSEKLKTSYEADAKERDYGQNAVYAIFSDDKEFEVNDPTGHGLEDLKNNLYVPVNSAEELFSQAKNLLRYVRLITQDQLEKRLTHLPYNGQWFANNIKIENLKWQGEEIHSQMSELFVTGNACLAFENLKVLNLLEIFFPNLDEEDFPWLLDKLQSIDNEVKNNKAMFNTNTIYHIFLQAQTASAIRHCRGNSNEADLASKCIDNMQKRWPLSAAIKNPLQLLGDVKKEFIFHNRRKPSYYPGRGGFGRRKIFKAPHPTFFAQHNTPLPTQHQVAPVQPMPTPGAGEIPFLPNYPQNTIPVTNTFTTQINIFNGPVYIQGNVYINQTNFFSSAATQMPPNTETAEYVVDDPR